MRQSEGGHRVVHEGEGGREISSERERAREREGERAIGRDREQERECVRECVRDIARGRTESFMRARKGERDQARERERECARAREREGEKARGGHRVVHEGDEQVDQHQVHRRPAAKREVNFSRKRKSTFQFFGNFQVGYLLERVDLGLMQVDISLPQNGNSTTHRAVEEKGIQTTGRCKVTWKREVNHPWREAGPLKHLGDYVESYQKVLFFFFIALTPRDK